MKCDQRRRAPDVQALFMPGSWACAQDALVNIENIGRINIFQEEITKLQVFFQIYFDYLDFSQQSFLQKWAASVFSEFSIIFYFLDATAIFLNFPASFLYFCPEIGGID